MDLQSLLAQAKQALSVLQNPSQSSVYAGGAAGAFSAELNNLSQQALVDIQDFGVQVPKPLQGIFNSVVAPVKTFLAPPAAPPTASSVLAPVGLVLAGVIAAAFLIGRRA